jgi:hypothetical protein
MFDLDQSISQWRQTNYLLSKKTRNETRTKYPLFVAVNPALLAPGISEFPNKIALFNFRNRGNTRFVATRDPYTRDFRNETGFEPRILNAPLLSAS